MNFNMIDKSTERKDESVTETKKRDYKAEYQARKGTYYDKYQSSTKAKKYRAELNKYNRKKGTYGNGDGKDASHKGGKIVGFEKESKNRGRAEKSRLKKESVNEARTINVEPNWEGMWRFFKQMAITNPRDWKRMERTLGSDWKKIDKMAQQKGWKSESVNEAVEPQGNMAKIAKVVKDKQATKLSGVMIDMQSASLLMKLYDKVSDKDKEKMNKLNAKMLTTVIKRLWSRVNLKLPV